MKFIDDPRLHEAIKRHPYPLLFVTLSGAHLYGFASPDSDFDLRGVHVLPPEKLLELEEPEGTVATESIIDGAEIDLVTHDARKFFGLLLKNNGYVLEQVFSPLILHARPEFDRLRELASQCITQHHVHHYMGFAKNEWKLLQKQPTIKHLLYVYRVLLTGLHLMETGLVEANLPTLNAKFKLERIGELLVRKVTGKEKDLLSEAELNSHAGKVEELMVILEASPQCSPLPIENQGKKELSELLVKLRLG